MTRENVARVGMWTLAGAAALGGMFWLSTHNYLLFHSLTELFSIIVACGIFMIAWNTRRFMENGFFVLLGVGYLCVAALDVLHTLAFPGMNILPAAKGLNLAPQLWIAARYVEASSLCMALLFLRRRIHAGATALFYGALFAFIALAIFQWEIFPDCYHASGANPGLTRFKIISEYAIIALLGLSLALLVRRPAPLEPRVRALIIGALGVAILSEFCFTLYFAPHGPTNMAGHLLKILSYYLLYQALIVMGLRRPFDALTGEVAERKRAEAHARTLNTLLEFFVRKACRKDYLEAIVPLLQQVSGCRCVGIRMLNARAEIPYEASTGFSEEFLRSESPLSLDKHECICTRVVRRAPGVHDMPLLTEMGSFWCGSTPDFVATLTEEQRRDFRGTCLRHGFSTLAVLPVRYGETVLGAVHLADERSGVITRDAMMLIEKAMLLIGEANYRFSVEQALVDSERRFHAIFQQSFQFVGLMSPDGTLIEANNSALEFIGLPMSAVAGRPFWETPWWQSSVRAQKRVRAAVAEAAAGAFVRYEAEIVGANGRRATIDFSIKPIRDDNGTVVQLLPEGRDITELRLLEKQLTEIGAEERARIGRDLHDVLGQQLTAISFLSESLAEDLRASVPGEAARAARIAAMVSDAASQTRALAKGLCPVEMDSDGLMAALDQFARNTSEVFGMTCRFRCDRPVLVEDPTVATHLYRIAAEAVTNSLKHGGAKDIQIRLTGTDSGINLSVKDNGTGLAQDAASAQGLGHRIMRYRAAVIGATLEVKNVDGGVVVLCWMPYCNTRPMEKTA